MQVKGVMLIRLYITEGNFATTRSASVDLETRRHNSAFEIIPASSRVN